MRGTIRSIAAALAIAMGLAAGAACSQGAEYLLLKQFFTASRLRDRTALARFATTVFEPREDGMVERFDVTNVSEERPRRSVGTDERAAHLSLEDPVDPVPTDTSPALTEREVTVLADVRQMDGALVSRRIVVTLVRARLNERRGRWVVTAFR